MPLAFLICFSFVLLGALSSLKRFRFRPVWQMIYSWFFRWMIVDCFRWGEVDPRLLMWIFVNNYVVFLIFYCDRLYLPWFGRTVHSGLRTFAS